VCPRRPLPPVIESTPYEKPYCIGIKWKRTEQDQDETTAFRIFLDGDLHHEMEISGRHSFKYDLTNLQANQMYRIHVKSVVGQKKLDGYSHQCSIESNASNELTLDCAAPPRGATPRIERMHANGIDIIWDPPAEDKHFKLTVSDWLVRRHGRSLHASPRLLLPGISDTEEWPSDRKTVTARQTASVDQQLRIRQSIFIPNRPNY
jgi:hypothetical protein